MRMFKGSFTALITPFKDGKIDERAFCRIVEWQISEGTHGLVPVGTTGESPTLSHDEHKRIVELTVETAKGRVPVIAGAGSNATGEAVELARFAKQVGADAVLVVTPYYNKPTQEGIYQHYRVVAEGVAIPQIVYNCPGRTGSSVSPETVARLSELDNIVALKDAADSIDYTTEVVTLCDLTVLSGADGLNFPIMALGGKGAISVLANVAPRLMADLTGAALAGDWAKALVVHKKVFPLCRALFWESNPIPVKAAAQMLGLVGPEIRMPLVPMTEGPREKLRVVMQEVGLL